jgi:hypothetical protein
MPLLAVAAIVAMLLLAWAGVELNDFIRAYPGQFYMAVFAACFIAVAVGIGRIHHAVRDQVPLAPPPPPLPAAIRAVPVLLAVAAPGAEEDAPGCEGLSCARKVSMDPWTARVEGDEDDHLFCSQECAQEWKDVRAAPSL